MDREIDRGKGGKREIIMNKGTYIYTCVFVCAYASACMYISLYSLLYKHVMGFTQISIYDI